jgi:hypothetical protein
MSNEKVVESRALKDLEEFRYAKEQVVGSKRRSFSTGEWAMISSERLIELAAIEEQHLCAVYNNALHDGKDVKITSTAFVTGLNKYHSHLISSNRSVWLDDIECRETTTTVRDGKLYVSFKLGEKEIY